MTRSDHDGDGARGVGGNAAPARRRDLVQRVASAMVLAPVVVAITYFGGLAFLALCMLAAAAILWEWTALVAGRGDARVLGPGWLSLALAALLIGLGSMGAAWVAIAVGCVVAGILSASLPRSHDPPHVAAWTGGGVLYAGAVLLGPALLRRDPQWGLTALLFLFATVWSTDIFAFFAGRAIGGAKLWPRVSPHKTWSGAAAGLAGGVAAGIAVAYASGIGKLGIVGVMALLLSVLAQAGDLFESAVKRRFGAKDASHLIPGHGGLMDRLDGFLVAAFAALLIGLVRQGTAAPAAGFLVW